MPAHIHKSANVAKQRVRYYPVKSKRCHKKANISTLMRFTPALLAMRRLSRGETTLRGINLWLIVNDFHCCATGGFRGRVKMSHDSLEQKKKEEEE